MIEAIRRRWSASFADPDMLAPFGAHELRDHLRQAVEDLDTLLAAIDRRDAGAVEIGRALHDLEKQLAREVVAAKERSACATCALEIAVGEGVAHYGPGGVKHEHRACYMARGGGHV